MKVLFVLLACCFGVWAENSLVQPQLQEQPLLAHMEGMEHGSAEEEGGLGEYHPLLVHFPIVLFIAAFAFDLLFLMGKIERPTYLPAHWLVIIGAVMAIPTVLTGLYASLMSDVVNNPYVPIHKAMALITLNYSLFHAIFRGYILKTKKEFSPKLIALISFVNVLLVVITAEYGGTITHGRGIFEHRSVSEHPAEKSH